MTTETCVIASKARIYDAYARRPSKVEEEDTGKKLTAILLETLQRKAVVDANMCDARNEVMHLNDVRNKRPSRKDNHAAYVAQYEEMLLEEVSTSQDLQARRVLQILGAQHNALDDNADEMRIAMKKARDAHHNAAMDGLKNRRWEYFLTVVIVVSSVAWAYFYLKSPGQAKIDELNSKARDAADKEAEIAKAIQDKEGKIAALQKNINECKLDPNDQMVNLTLTSEELLANKKKPLEEEMAKLKAELDDLKKKLADLKKPPLSSAALKDQAEKQDKLRDLYERRAEIAKQIATVSGTLKAVSALMYDAEVQHNQHLRSLDTEEVNKCTQDKSQLEREAKEALQTAERLDKERREATLAMVRS